MRNCAKCNEPTPEALFKSSGTICEFCWQAGDLGRHEELPRPKVGDKPDARVILLQSGKLAITCPHCFWNVLRPESYFERDPQITRCPRCMAHYTVKKGEAE